MFRVHHLKLKMIKKVEKSKPLKKIQPSLWGGSAALEFKRPEERCGCWAVLCVLHTITRVQTRNLSFNQQRWRTQGKRKFAAANQMTSAELSTWLFLKKNKKTQQSHAVDSKLHLLKLNDTVAAHTAQGALWTNICTTTKKKDWFVAFYKESSTSHMPFNKCNFIKKKWKCLFGVLNMFPNSSLSFFFERMQRRLI